VHRRTTVSLALNPNGIFLGLSKYFLYNVIAQLQNLPFFVHFRADVAVIKSFPGINPLLYFCAHTWYSDEPYNENTIRKTDFSYEIKILNVTIFVSIKNYFERIQQSKELINLN